jgi:hypothetical protein
MAARIFTRDVGRYKTGEISDLPSMAWNEFARSAAIHQGLPPDGLDSFSLPVEEAARRYVRSLSEAPDPGQPRRPRPARAGREGDVR